MIANDYYESIDALLAKIYKKQQETIKEIANKVGENLSEGGILHTFGSGHSSMIAKEITGRAGGLVPINQIIDPTEGMAERVGGYADYLLEDYEKRYQMEPGEFILVISNSGRNPLPIEIALGAKHRDMNVVAITSIQYSSAVNSRHSSNKKLYEIADHVLDNYVDFGDTLVSIPNSEMKTGAGSTIAGAFLANLLALNIIQYFNDKELEAPILKSRNIDGADEFNDKLIEQYGSRLSWC